MRAYLVKGKELKFQLKKNTFVRTNWVGESYFCLSANDIEPYIDKAYTALHKKLKNHLKTMGKQNLDMTLKRAWFDDPYLEIDLTGDILSDLSLILGTKFETQMEIIRLQVCTSKSLANRVNGILKSRQFSILSQTRAVSKVKLKPYRSGDIRYSGETDMHKSWSSHWPTHESAADAPIAGMRKLTFAMKFNIIVSVNNNDAHDILFPQNTVTMNRQLLEGQYQADMEIVGSNGKSVKCHSIFLAANSDVIKVMFESNFVESATKKIEMNDMSETAIRALLEFMYCRNLVTAEENSMVAVELLKAAEKYMIKSLEYGVKSILLEQPVTWLEVDAALTLYLFVINLDQHKDLKGVAVKTFLLKRKQLLQSSLYRQLNEKNPSAAKRILRLK